MNNLKLTDLRKVNHDYKYHAEIKYETEHSFDFKSAVGDNLKEFMLDIEIRLKQLYNRKPKLVQALLNPQKDSVNITGKIIELMQLNPIYWNK